MLWAIGKASSCWKRQCSPATHSFKRQLAPLTWASQDPNPPSYFSLRVLRSSMPKKRSLAAPVVLQPFDKPDKSVIRTVIETPKYSRNKYKFEPALASFTLSKVLPKGMTFPYDFGFVPSTEGDDGDPIDVLLLMDEPAFPGCVIESRLIGVIESRADRRRRDQAQRSPDSRGQRKSRIS